MHQLLEQTRWNPHTVWNSGVGQVALSQWLILSKYSSCQVSTLKNYLAKVTETHQLNEEFRKDQSFRKRIIRVSASAAPTDRSNSPKHSNFQLGNLKTTDSDTQILVSRRFSSYVRN